MTSGKELISLCAIAATVKEGPHTAFSPWHVSCLRGLDVGWVGTTGWFGAHSNLFPCLWCKQQSLQVCLHFWFKRFRAETCTDSGTSSEEAYSYEVHVSEEPRNSQAQQRAGLAAIPAGTSCGPLRKGQGVARLPHLQFFHSSLA